MTTRSGFTPLDSASAWSQRVPPRGSTREKLIIWPPLPRRPDFRSSSRQSDWRRVGPERAMEASRRGVTAWRESPRGSGLPSCLLVPISTSSIDLTLGAGVVDERLVVDGFFAGRFVVGDGFQGDVGDLFVFEAAANAFVGVSEFVVVEGGAHEALFGEGGGDAGGVAGDPAAA